MGLFAELNKGLPRIAYPKLARSKGPLEVALDRVAEVFAGVPNDPSPPRDLLTHVEKLLSTSESNLQGLSRQELKVIPYLIWGTNPSWRRNPGFVRDFLAEVDIRWGTGHRRIWRHYVLNFDASCPATRIVARWLWERQERLPELLQNFSIHYALFDVAVAPSRLAASTLEGPNFLAELTQIGISAELLRSSAMCITILRSAGGILSRPSLHIDALSRLRALLADNPDQAIAAARCDSALRADALRAIIDGLVDWQQQRGQGADSEPLLAFLLALNGDPRFAADRWHGKVAASSLQAVESWLSRKTIESFFRVIDALKTERNQMWQSRHRFWQMYLPHIDGAWLIVGPRAEYEANRQDVGRFARFEGTGTLQDHCGLLVRLGSVCVMEMNMNGSAIFWREGAYQLNGLFEATYNRKKYRDIADGIDVVVLAHRGSWEDVFSKRIAQMGGPLVRGYW